MDRQMIEQAVHRHVADLPGEWTISFAPDAELLPAALQEKQLDAVAIGPSGAIAYQVVAGRRALRDQAMVSKMVDLQQAVSTSPGWKFELILLPEPPPKLLRESEVDRLLASVELIRRLHTPSAFLLAFSVLEWALAVRANESGLDYSPNAQRLASDLVQAGQIDDALLANIRRFQTIRNGIAHAVEAPPPADADLNLLLDSVRDLRLATDGASRESGQGSLD